MKGKSSATGSPPTKRSVDTLGKASGESETSAESARARSESTASAVASRAFDAGDLRARDTPSSLYGPTGTPRRLRLPLRLFLRALHDLIGHALLPPVLSPVVHHPQHRSPHDEEGDDVGEDEDDAEFAELHRRSDDVDGLGGFLGVGRRRRRAGAGEIRARRRPRRSRLEARGGAGAERFTSMPDSSRESLTMSPMDWPPESSVKTHSMGWPASAGAGAASETKAASESATPRTSARRRATRRR